MADGYKTNASVVRRLAEFDDDETLQYKLGTIISEADGRWVCGSAFYEAWIPTYSQRIGELIAQGAQIERSRCTNPNHRHGGSIAAYRWVRHSRATR